MVSCRRRSLPLLPRRLPSSKLPSPNVSAATPRDGTLTVEPLSCGCRMPSTGMDCSVRSWSDRTQRSSGRARSIWRWSSRGWACSTSWIFSGVSMPNAAPKACPWPGCPKKIKRTARYCDAHLSEHRKMHDARRGSAADRGYGWRWQQARLVFLAQHPLCRPCESVGRVMAATIVDHIRPHRGDQALFWDAGNWQPCCAACHDRKTATEDGGWGKHGGRGGVNP